MAAVVEEVAQSVNDASKSEANGDDDDSKPKSNSRHPSPDLRADAPAFVPQEKEFKLPPKVKTVRPKDPKKDMYHVFDAVPFTPSQGVKTPSPSNMAALRWQMYSPFATAPHYMPESPNTVLRNFAPSDTSSNSDTSAPQVASPVHPSTSMPYSPLMFYPLAMPGFPPGDHHPLSPHGPPSPLIPGSPVSTPTGAFFAPFSPALHSGPYSQVIASQAYPSPPMYSSPPNSNQQRPHPPYPPEAPPGFRPAAYPYMPIPMQSPPNGPFQHMDMHGRGRGPFPHPGAFHPHRLSRSHMYSPGIAFAHGHMGPMPPALQYSNSAPHPPTISFARKARVASRSAELPEDAVYSADGKTKFKPRKNNSEPKIGADGMPRLNARQRRTLRRAKERALKALMETGSKLLQKAGLGNLQLAEFASGEDDSANDSGSNADDGPSSLGSGSPMQHHRPPRQLSAEQCEANRAEAAAAVSQALAECSVETPKNPMELDSNNITDLIQQLSVKQDEGLVDEKLIRDLQIIQGLLGALKQTTVPAKSTPPKPHRSPAPGPRPYERSPVQPPKSPAQVLPVPVPVPMPSPPMYPS